MESFEKRIKLQRQIERFNIEKSVRDSFVSLIDEDVQKGLSSEQILEKAKSGVYADTWANRKKGVVGQKYGSKKEDGEKKSESEKVTEVIRTFGSYKKMPSDSVIDQAFKQQKVYKDKNNFKEAIETSVRAHQEESHNKDKEEPSRTSNLYPKQDSRDDTYSSKEMALDAQYRMRGKKGGANVVKYKGKYIVTNGIRAGEYMKQGASWVRPNGEEVSSEKWMEAKNK